MSQSRNNKPASTPSTLPAEGLVRTAMLLRIIPISRSTLFRKIAAGDFPAPVHLSKGCVAHRVEDVRGWIASLPK